MFVLMFYQVGDVMIVLGAWEWGLVLMFSVPASGLLPRCQCHCRCD